MRKTTPIFILLNIILIAVIGCSSHNSKPVTAPSMPDTQAKIDIPTIDNETDLKGHELLGVWTMSFDPKTNNVSVEPNRENLWHFNVKQWIPNPGIWVNSYDPGTGIIDVNVTLRNSYPISGYDVRLIIYTDNIGHMLLNPDNWTPLYDISGGQLINPFKAYAKSEPNRLFAGSTSHMENIQVLMPEGNFQVKFAVDASYPSNCEEPYEIYNLVQEEPLYDRLNDSAPANITIARWNTQESATVTLECPDVFGAEIIEFETQDNEYFEGELINYQNAPAGEYPVLIKAGTGHPVVLYDYDTIIITKKPVYGWAHAFVDDTDVPGVETDENGNAYLALNPTLRILAYTKDEHELFQRDIESPFYELRDMSYNPNYPYIYSTGTYYYCGTTDFSGMSVAKCYKGVMGGCSDTYQCFDYPVESNDIEGDSSGNAYITGVGYDNEHSRVVMWKIDSTKTTQWTNIFENDDGGMEFNDLEVSSSDTIYGAGYFWGTTVDMDPSDGVLNFTPRGVEDAFLSEWDSDGSYIDIVRWGGYDDETASVSADIVGSDDSGNVFVTGNFMGQVDFNPNLFFQHLINSHDEFEMYISKFNSTFGFQDCIRIGGLNQGTAYPFGMAFDMDGNVYICGRFKGTVDFDPSRPLVEKTALDTSDMFLAKYDNDLNFIWVQAWSSDNFEEATDVAYDPIYNFVYLGGHFAGILDFDPGDGIFELIPTDIQDAFLMKLLPNGTWEY
jgi:hypothetical protein